MTSAEFKAIREQLGLSQVELGEIMGMPQSHISRLERGERKPTKNQASFIRYILRHRP